MMQVLLVSPRWIPRAKPPGNSLPAGSSTRQPRALRKRALHVEETAGAALGRGQRAPGIASSTSCARPGCRCPAGTEIPRPRAIPGRGLLLLVLGPGGCRSVGRNPRCGQGKHGCVYMVRMRLGSARCGCGRAMVSNESRKGVFG